MTFILALELFAPEETSHVIACNTVPKSIIILSKKLLHSLSSVRRKLCVSS